MHIALFLKVTCLKNERRSASVYQFALGKEAELTVSKLAARRVAKIRTFSDC